jgi:putative tryptophan/tyrosine transport system substrate-binding protein
VLFLIAGRHAAWKDQRTLDASQCVNRFDQLPALAADLVRSKPDLIVAVAAQAARAAKNATSDIPIVMLFVGDPVGLGFAASLAQPGGNMTGVTALVPGDFIGKILNILREALPQAKRLAIVIFKREPSAAIPGDTTSGR